MSPCEKCGTATQIVETTGGTKSGRFKEVYECVHGHKGYIHGDAAESPRNWTKYGPVFDHE